MKIDVTRFPLWKKLLFSLFPAFILLILLLIVEAGLRVGFPSLRNPFLDTLSYSGTTWNQINRKYLRKYFPPSIAVLPEFKPGIFRAEKPDSTFRIVCLGSSSMFGTPYQMTANIPGIVRRQLRHLAPDKEIEVINLGASAINSNVVRDFLDEVVALEPTLVLIYMGHNEFYGPDGIGAAPLEKALPWVTRIKYRFRDLALGSLLSSLFSSTPDQSDGLERTLMREVSSNSAVHLDSPDARRIERIFEANLDAILEELKDHRIPVIISDIVSNLHFRPFLSDSTLPDGNPIPREFTTLSAAKGDLRSLSATIKKVLENDSTNAMLHYRLGEVLTALGNGSEARKHLLLAKDLDLLKFRAPESINATIHSVAAHYNVPLVSADSVFQSLSPYGIPGNNLFWEHLHPTVYGYYEIANLFVRRIVDLGLVVPSPEGRFSLLPFDSDSLSLAWLDLAYADLSMKNLTTHWPFRDYSIQPMVIDTSDPALVDIAMRVYTLREGWDDGCHASIQHFERTKHPSMAITTYLALLDEFPYDLGLRYRLANLYKNFGRPEESIREYERILADDPHHLSSLIELGLLDVNFGRFDQSISLLSRALRENLSGNASAEATIHYGLAGAYANKEDMSAALGHLRESLRLNPSYTAALELQSAILQSQRTTPGKSR